MIDAASMLAVAMPPAGANGAAGATRDANAPAADGSASPFTALLATSSAAGSTEGTTPARGAARRGGTILPLPGVAVAEGAQAAERAPGDRATETLGEVAAVGSRIHRLLPPRAEGDAAMLTLQAILTGHGTGPDGPPVDPTLAGVRHKARGEVDDETGPRDDDSSLGRSGQSDTDDESPATDAGLALPAAAVALTPVAASARDARPRATSAGTEAGPASALPERILGSAAAAPRGAKRSSAPAESSPAASSPVAAPRAADTPAQGPIAPAATPGDAARASTQPAGDALTGATSMPVAASSSESRAGTSSDLAGALPLPQPHVVDGARTPHTASAAEASMPFHAQLSAAIDSPNFGSALSLQISTLVTGDISEARLHLHPAELGPIAVQIGLEGQFAQVHLAAEHAATRHALEQALPELARTLQEAGFTMSGGGVSQQAPRDPQASNPQGTRGDAAAAAAGEPAETARVAAGAVARTPRGLLDLFA